jgi:hypothetical protein
MKHVILDRKSIDIKKTIWISYDLGLNGDYEGLYKWLDSQGAKECGENLTVLNFFYKRTPSKDVVSELTKALQENVHLKDKDRIYAIYLDDKTKKMKGKFLFGSRKPAPWAGFARKYSKEDVAK